MATPPRPAPWLIHFFQRAKVDDADETVPALDFFETLSENVAAEVHAVLDAVAEAPPPAFSGGGKWQAMRSEMAGFYEVRVQGSHANHRLFCLLERNADDLGGSSIICLGGLTKPRRQPADPKDYRRIRRYREEFERNRTVFS